MNERQSVLVVGAGDATGGAIARRFARAGLVACLTRRTADKLEPLVEQIRTEGGRTLSVLAAKTGPRFESGDSVGLAWLPAEALVIGDRAGELEDES